MKKTKYTFSSEKKTTSLKCMNSNPETSKWGLYAPIGGCDEIIHNVSTDTKWALCYKCTMRAADNRRLH